MELRHSLDMSCRKMGYMRDKREERGGYFLPDFGVCWKDGMLKKKISPNVHSIVSWSCS